MVEINNPNEEWIRKEYIMDNDLRTLPEEFCLREHYNYVEILEQIVAELKEQ